MDLLDQPQAAELTRLSGRTLERHRLAGTGPKFVRLGRRVFYRRDDLEEWIADCTCRSTSEADQKAAQNSDRRMVAATERQEGGTPLIGPAAPIKMPVAPEAHRNRQNLSAAAGGVELAGAAE